MFYVIFMSLVAGLLFFVVASMLAVGDVIQRGPRPSRRSPSQFDEAQLNEASL